MALRPEQGVHGFRSVPSCSSQEVGVARLSPARCKENKEGSVHTRESESVYKGGQSERGDTLSVPHTTGDA